MRTIFCLVAVTLGLSAAAQPAKRAEVLVLGVYHMANPGHDIFNMPADDVLAPTRQQEIAALASVLKKFKPTKIALENDSQKKMNERYAKYLAGEYALTANEIDQIGLRLAKDLGHTTIYAVDADGDFPFQRVINFAKATGQSPKLEATMSEIGAMVKAQGDYLKNHTVLQTLIFMNSDSKAAQDVGFYYAEGPLRRAGRLRWPRPAGRVVPEKHPHLQQRDEARDLLRRSNPRHLRRGPPRLAPPGFRLRPDDPTP
jgi:hypothetical protein